MAWVELHRRFIRASDASELSALSSEVLHQLPFTLGWEELLPYRAVVVFGEAGAGKTAELQARARHQSALGHAAFFLPVESVAAGLVHDALTPDDRQRFDAWLVGGEAAWLFLDSVDEARLHRRTLSTALRLLRTHVGDAIRRVHIVVSSRASDWRVDADEPAIREFAANLHVEPGPGEVVLTMLAPLLKAQVRTLATHEGAVEVDAFIDAVNNANAWAFVSRPLDVRRVVRGWNRSKHLGSLTEIVEHDVSERLKETSAEPLRSANDLAPSDAREGAGILALASRLMGASSFVTPGAEGRAGEAAIEAAGILETWSSPRLQALLTRGLFDEATYGRVRIHHRTTQDYLAAQCVRRLRTEGMADRELERLFFRSNSNRIVVPPELRGVLGWLAQFDSAALRLTVEHAPEELLDEGDPAALTIQKRREIIRAYARRFADRNHLYRSIDQVGLRRFAAPELAADLRSLLGAAEAEHVRDLVLDTVRVGALSELAEEALAIALDPDSSDLLRRSAIRAVLRAGSEGVRAQLLRLLETEFATDPDILESLLGSFFPTHIEPQAAVRLVLAVHRDSRWRTGLDRLLPQLPSLCREPTQVMDLVEELDTAITRDSVGAAPLLAGCFVEAVAASVELLVTTNRIGRVVDLLVVLCTRDQHDLVYRMLRDNAAVRRAIFWHSVDTWAEVNREFPREAHQVRGRRLSRLTGEDSAWLQGDCVAGPPRRRMLAFSALSGLMTEEALRAFVAGLHEAERGAFEVRMLESQQAAASQDLLRGDPQIAQARLDRRREADQRNADIESMRRLLPRLADGSALAELEHLVNDFDLAHFPQTRAGYTRFAETYGADVAAAVRAALKKHWRTNKPVALCDLPGFWYRNSLWSAGIGAEMQDGLDLRSLDTTLRQRAILVAASLDNGFEAWLDFFAQEDASTVRQELTAAIRGEYEFVPGTQGDAEYRLICSLAHASQPIRAALAPVVSSLITAGDPPISERLEDALNAIDSLEPCDDGWVAMVAERARSVGGDLQRLPLWWSRWIICAPTDALDHLEHVLGSAEGRTIAVETFGFMGRRYGRYEQDPPARPPMRASELARLYRIIVRFISESDSAPVGREYNPTSLDDAHDFRRSVKGWLVELPGPETVHELDLLAMESPTQRDRDWFRSLADVRASDNVGVETFTAGQVLDLLAKHARPPRNSADLHQLALDRLDDIARHLRGGDFAPRGLYSPLDDAIDEVHVQLFLANELQLRSRNHYTVDRESEVVSRKRTDIRLQDSRCGGLVTIEVKVLEKWSVKELRRALERQLVGQYMAEMRSQFGIFALASSGPRRNAAVHDLAIVVATLQSDADQLVLRKAASGLQVVVLDFHSPADTIVPKPRQRRTPGKPAPTAQEPGD